MSGTFVAFLIFDVIVAIALVLSIRLSSLISYKHGENLVHKEKEEAAAKDSGRYYDRGTKPLPHGDVAWFENLQTGVKVVGTVFAGLAVIFLISSIFYVVPVRNVGIVTSYSSPTGRTTGNGLVEVWPWQEVADFDASKITSDHASMTTCITVRIGSMATACVESKITLQVRDEAAPQLYKDYKGDFNNFRTNFVELNIQLAINHVFATYNPLSQINLQTGQTGFDGARLGEQVKQELTRAIGDKVTVWIVSIPIVHHDKKTEQNIQAFQDVVAQARILAQQKANADLEAQVAATQRSYLTPEFIQNKCIEASIKMGVPPGLCLVGNGAIVDTTK